MNSDLNNFFKEEKNRIFEPGPFFVQKVMARLKDQGALRLGVWESVPGAVRPVFALALLLMFAVLAIQILVPVEPTRGALEAAVTSDLTPSEVLLFTGAEGPTSSDYIQELILESAQ